MTNSKISGNSLPTINQPINSTQPIASKALQQQQLPPLVQQSSVVLCQHLQVMPKGSSCDLSQRSRYRWWNYQPPIAPMVQWMISPRCHGVIIPWSLVSTTFMMLGNAPPKNTCWNTHAKNFQWA